MNASIDSLSSTRARFGAWDRFLRTRLLASVGQLRGGRLEIHDPLGQVTAGDERSDTIIRLHINDAGFYHAVATRGSVGAGESYMDGAWRCDDLVGLIRLLVRNRDLLDRMEIGMARFGGMAMRGVHALRANTRAGARRNIAAHYDLGNDFFRLFLSEDMMYSSALWAHDADTLEAASERKLARIAEKLQLGPADHVIEIGTGWGGFALHAAGRYGCRVTTTTISREQYELAKARIAEAGLQDRVDVLLSDYRDLRGQYDKLVSIEMIEAIGHAQQREYFGQIGKLLKPDGRALIQAITIEDHRYQQALNSVDFIKRHVFPGCFIPSISSMLEAKTKSTDLALVHLEDFGSSYAKTLQAWRERFLSRLDEVRAQGYDERLIRMWEFYLAYCEGGFRERSIGVAHLLFAKPDCRDADYLPGLERLEA